MNKIALIILSFAWIIQLVFVLQEENRNIQPSFIILYCLGYGIFLFDRFMMGIMSFAQVLTFAIPNIGVPLLVLSVLFGKKKRKRSTTSSSSKRRSSRRRRY